MIHANLKTGKYLAAWELEIKNLLTCGKLRTFELGKCFLSMDFFKNKLLVLFPMSRRNTGKIGAF